MQKQPNVASVRLPELVLFEGPDVDDVVLVHFTDGLADDRVPRALAYDMQPEIVVERVEHKTSSRHRRPTIACHCEAPDGLRSADMGRTLGSWLQ